MCAGIDLGEFIYSTPLGSFYTNQKMPLCRMDLTYVPQQHWFSTMLHLNGMGCAKNTHQAKLKHTQPPLSTKNVISIESWIVSVFQSCFHLANWEMRETHHLQQFQCAKRSYATYQHPFELKTLSTLILWISHSRADWVWSQNRLWYMWFSTILLLRSPTENLCTFKL